jgi:putative two-component system response regulator
MHVLARYDEPISVWVAALSLYDAETADHGSRVARGARELGRSAGLSDDEVELAGCAGLLHDIGKLRVPLSILTDTGPLGSDDWARIRRHPADGAEIIGSLSVEHALVAGAVRAHHERWDGSGYPDGLCGEAIPMLGRIVALADVFDALTHTRCYREGVFSTEEALVHIETGAGRLFDPDLVAVFVRTITGERQAGPIPSSIAVATTLDVR